MLAAIDSLVRLFEGLTIAPVSGRATAARHADNDNGELDEEERRWAAYR
jgi:hypothetical protein